MEIEIDCFISKIETDLFSLLNCCPIFEWIQNRNGFETELPLLKIEKETILSLFCWNLKPIRNGNNSVSIN